MKQFEVFSLSASNRLDENDLWSLMSEDSLDSALLDEARVITVESGAYRFWISENDTTQARLAVIKSGPILNQATMKQRNRVLERCKKFFDLSGKFPLVVPFPWTSFVADDKAAFYATSKDTIPTNPRWIVKYQPSDIIYFWALYPGDETYRRRLEDENIDESAIQIVRKLWPEVVESTKDAFATSSKRSSSSIILEPPTTSYHAIRQYDEWLKPGALSERQREFILQGIGESIRLKGPAGSGKTLSLELKMIHDTLSLLEGSDSPRILFATHNWSMALQVDEDISFLDNGLGVAEYVTIAPLTSIISEIRPVPPGVEILGEDSEEGNVFQMTKLEEVLEAFLDTKFVKFKFETSKTLSSMLESSTERTPQAETFRRDLLGEFNTVMGGADIQIGPNDLSRYRLLARLPQWLELPQEIDRDAVYEIYSMFLQSLQEDGLLTVDQFMSTSLKWFNGFEWGPLRRTRGYDLIYVDELHLFNQQERAMLNFLGRDARETPRVFMSLDPLQSPNGRYGNFIEDKAIYHEQSVVELDEVHRYTPEILAFVKHVNGKFPTEDFGEQWRVDINSAESRFEHGPIPEILDCHRSAKSEVETCFERAELLMSRQVRVAIAVIDEQVLDEYLHAAEGRMPRKNVAILRTREDLGVITKSRKGLVVGHAKHLAGLQFDEVIIAGIGDLSAVEGGQWIQKEIQFLSHLYLASSRAQTKVTIVIDSDEHGVPEVLKTAQDLRLISRSSI